MPKTESFALASQQSQLVSLKELMSVAFQIPSFQRLYAWEEPQWQALLDDLNETFRNGKALFLGLCVVTQNNNNSYDVIDGQQRLTTLAILLHALGDDTVVQSRPDGSASVFIHPQEPDGVWLNKLFAGENVDSPERYSQKLIRDAHRFFTKAKENNASPSLDHIRDSQLIVYCSPNLQGATLLYERINTRGIAVAKLELVKNKLFDWASRIEGKEKRSLLERDIQNRFRDIYKHLNPKAQEGAIDPDQCLRVHWILFDDNFTKTTDLSDALLDRIDQFIGKRRENGSNPSDETGRAIREYLSSLEDVVVIWRKVAAPQHCPSSNGALTSALLSFSRLHRDANYVPALVAAIKQWTEQSSKTVEFVKMLEIANFREALAQNQSNTGRAAKWKLAKLIWRNEYTFEQAKSFAFWECCPWWNKDEVEKRASELAGVENTYAEDGLNLSAARNKLGRYLHYLFWEYGLWLQNKPTWPETREDVSVQTPDQWEQTFRSLEVEHIFPQNPLDKETKIVKSRMKAMEPYLNHLGNLTLLTKRDNGSLQNSVFEDKLAAVLQDNSNLLFNKILANRLYRGNLSDGAWGPNNCVRRIQEIIKFANERWGMEALKAYKFDEPYESNELAGTDEEQEAA